MRNAREKDEEPGVDTQWWFNVKLDVSVTLRSGPQTATARYACTPREASWECQRRVERETPSACNERSGSHRTAVSGAAVHPQR